MKCPKCGKELSEFHKFCTQCGTVLDGRTETNNNVTGKNLSDNKAAVYYNPSQQNTYNGAQAQVRESRASKEVRNFASPRSNDGFNRNQNNQGSVNRPDNGNTYNNNYINNQNYNHNNFQKANNYNDDKTRGLFADKEKPNNAFSENAGFPGNAQFFQNNVGYGNSGQPMQMGRVLNDKINIFSIVSFLLSLMSLVTLFFNWFKIKSPYKDLSISMNIISLNSILNIVTVDDIEEIVGAKVMVTIFVFLLLAVAAMIIAGALLRYINHDLGRIVVPVSYIVTAVYSVISLIGVLICSLSVKSELGEFDIISVVPTPWIFISLALSIAGFVLYYCSNRR